MNANINKNLIGDTLVLKPVKSKGMPAWFKLWSDTEFKSVKDRLDAIDVTLKDQKVFNQEVKEFMINQKTINQDVSDYIKLHP
jgi:DNA recombination-dependent growth factor C